MNQTGSKLKADIYRPNEHTHTPVLRSPEYVQLSAAAAITLGFIPGQIYRAGCTHCLNLLVTYPEGCRANCSYCGLARHREESRDYADRNFIRVDWPTISYKEILQAVIAGNDQQRFQRMCISMITHPDSDDDTLDLLRQWTQQIAHIPVSILSNPTTLDEAYLKETKRLGADIFTIALDAVTPQIFEHTRGKTVDSPHRWDKYWQTIEWAASVFGPEKFGVHLIAGMGETEQEMMQVVQQVKDMGGHNHMFAFYPEKGSMMEEWPAVGHGHWRRVQLARFIIDYCSGNVGNMQFNDKGQICHFGIEDDILDKIIDQGKAFQTSGCPGKDDEQISACNRPYGDSKPSDILSYPFPLNSEDVGSVKKQMEI